MRRSYCADQGEAARVGHSRDTWDAAFGRIYFLRSTTAAVGSRLSITIKDGRFFWAGRDGRPLTVTTTEDYTYLTSTEPGTYVRFTELGNRLLYVEHLDMPFGSVTFWGEARVVFGK